MIALFDRRIIRSGDVSVSRKLPFAYENRGEQERSGDNAPKGKAGLRFPVNRAAGEIAQRDFVEGADVEKNRVENFEQFAAGGHNATGHREGRDEHCANKPVGENAEIPENQCANANEAADPRRYDKSGEPLH